MTNVPAVLPDSQDIKQFLLESMVRHVYNKEVIDDSQDGFTTGKLCLMNLVVFYDMIKALVNGKNGKND